MPQLVRHSGFDFNALRVIVVEDNETNRTIVCRMMRQLNCAVVESAADGDQAMTVMLGSSHGYDLIISDNQRVLHRRDDVDQNSRRLMKRCQVLSNLS